jgi:LmbE family N-acetylglucosaminyl deacetylase
MTEMQSVLVVAAHPDDEVLGCGGAMARLATECVEVNVAFLADGVASREAESSEMQIQLAERRRGAREAARILGVKNVSFGAFADNQMDTVALLEIIRTVEGLIDRLSPDTVITHHCGDLNIDHRRTCEAVFTACRPQSGHPVKRLLCCEVPSSTEWQPPPAGTAFNPNWFVDISGFLDRKLAALEAYSHELREWPHPRSRRAVENLARWRGATVGVQAAEAYFLGRCLE